MASRLGTHCSLSLKRIIPHNIKDHPCLYQLQSSYNSFKGTISNERHMTTSSAGQQRRYIPRRSAVFVPGHVPEKLKKIPSLGADCTVIECEDGVPMTMKEKARKSVKEALQNGLKSQAKNIDISIRLNSVWSELLEDDLKALFGNALGEPLAADLLPQSLVVPKVDTVEELDTFTEMLAAYKLGRPYVPYFLFFVESAVGLMNLSKILEKASEHTRNGHYILDGIYFGSHDFCADIGAEKTPEAKEVIYARQKVITLAKAFKLQAIDMVNFDLLGLSGLKEASEFGASIGFTGKQTLHPAQVPIINQAYTPSEERVQWATDLAQAFDEHQRGGQGAFVYKGKMIDMPLLKQAQNVLEVMNKINKA